MKPEISQKDLFYLLDMRPQSLGELLSKLEKSGYITREQSETDRRVMNIKLTKEGIAATEATEQEFSFDKLFDCLSEEEQKTMSGFLDRIIKTLETQLGDEEPEFNFDPSLRGGNPFDRRFQFGPRPGMGHGRRPGSYPGIIFIPILIFGNRLFAVNGVIWANTISEGLTSLVGLILFLGIWKKVNPTYS